ncbi:autotransporter outer membrane beta-barrel domain-containing protein [Acerihabitans sp. TG2]|uniref:autotransporter outer membrane beta-barrel domain-containing protein n=1 Tax=Acerihabitans sp. TG2 TaxID=3096008 RepID=UPI002B236D79|nr:autotransporter outer membrane beta-barrel domain-containing protein [Acerihabitans sp. TG2]MEA9393383.1 autotransporter outer membrane beta-barrel domain-containing protein [Acerihabitans sp. TG2]
MSNDPNLTEGKHTALIQNNTYGNEELTSQDNNEFNHSVFKADIEINNLNNHEVYEEAFDWGASRRASNSSLTSLLDDTAENIDYESAALLLEQQWDVFNNDVYEELETKINDIDSFNLSSTTNDGDASGAGSTTNDGDASGAGSTTSDGDASGAGSTTSDGDASGAGSTSSDGGTDEGDTTAIMDAVQEQDETVITESEVLADPRLAPEPCDFFIPQPQAGIYIANLSAANTMFAHRMHDRIGEPTFPATFGDLADGIQPAMWLRVGGGRNTTQVRKGQLETSTSMGLVHGGGELVNWHVNGNDSLHLGVMFGAGKSHSHSHVADTGLLATGHVEGYSTGIYATWHQHDNTHQGLYVDGSLSYNWFVNQVDTPMSATKGIAGNAHAYRSRGFIGSLESGYNWNIFSGERVDAYLQPQMQITWLGVKAHIDGDNNGERLDMLGNDRVQTRLGTRLFLRGYASRDSGKQRMFQPYVEASWLHNNQAYGVRLNHETYRQDGTRNIGEIRMGNDGQINQHLALWGNVTQQIGDDGFHETLGTLGIKVNF